MGMWQQFTYNRVAASLKISNSNHWWWSGETGTFMPCSHKVNTDTLDAPQLVTQGVGMLPRNSTYVCIQKNWKMPAHKTIHAKMLIAILLISAPKCERSSICPLMSEWTKCGAPHVLVCRSDVLGETTNRWTWRTPCQSHSCQPTPVQSPKEANRERQDAD